MDPSAIKSLYKNSFENTDIQTFLHTYPVPIVPSFSSDSTVKTPKKVNNQNLYDPFHNFPIEPFLNRDAITLANIDAVFNFSKHTSGYIMPQETKDYTFATIDDENNGFIQYMLYRNPNSYGYGISSKPLNSVIDSTHFNHLQTKVNCDNCFVNFVKSVEVTGVDTIIGNYSNEINSEGYLIRLLTCLKIISIGGTFVCKIRFDETLSKLLYLTSKCFEKITLFKPISTSAYDGIYYVIAQNANKNNLDQIANLLNYQKIETSNDFINWLHQYYFLINSYNQFLIDHKEDYELYDTYKCKAMWNLP